MRSSDVLDKVVPGEVISVAQTDLIDSVINVGNAESFHPPNLLEFAINHDSVRVTCHSSLLSKSILLSFLRNQEGYRLLYVFEG